jgi:hypothetical protein
MKITDKPTSEERVHHPYSPSSLQCREACPKFQQRGGPVHEMALTGTKQHDAIDNQLDDPSLPDYRAMAVTDCITLCEQRIKAYPGGTILREVYLPIDDETVVARDGTVFWGTTAGYLDFGIVSADGKTAEILDWKFGNNAVEEAQNNLQGIAYALGILKQFPNLETIKVGFVMPHADFASEHVFTRADFPGMLLRVVTVVRRAELANNSPDDFSYASPNTSSCRFCGLIAKCPAVAAKVIAVGRKYAPLKIPECITPSLVCDPAQVKLGMGLADIVKTWADAYRAQANAKSIEDPTFVPDGYTLVSTSKREVIDARKLGELAKTYLPEGDRSKVDSLYDVAIGKLEKLIATAAVRGQKETTVEDFGLSALALGALKEGTPFAFLRQSRVQDKDKVSKS